MNTLSRYFLKEAVAAWLAVMGVLLLIMLSSRSVRFLTAAAEGSIPAELVLSVVFLSGLQYLMIILPISILLGVMLAMGRMYKDQEITAATACGVSLARIARPFALLALFAAAATAALAIDLGPRAGRMADRLIIEAREQLAFAPFESGRFTSLGGGDAVFYTERVRAGGAEFDQVFIRSTLSEFSGVIVASGGSQEGLAQGGQREIALHDGKAYDGDGKGGLAWDIFSFDELRLRLVPPELIYTPGKTKIEATPTLLLRDDAEANAEFHWRLSAPVAVLLMVLIAVPLSHISPRQGRYAKLVVGLVVYLLYVTLLGAGQTALEKDLLPRAVGLWPVHAAALLLGAVLWWRRIGRRS